MEKNSEVKFFFLKNLVGFVAWFAVFANLFRLGSSIQKHAGSTLACTGEQNIWKKNWTDIFFRQNLYYVLESFETYDKKFAISSF